MSDKQPEIKPVKIKPVEESEKLAEVIKKGSEKIADYYNVSTDNVIKVKLDNGEIVLPKEGDVGFDLVAKDRPKITPKYVEYSTGVYLDQSTTYALLYPRSSISNYDLVLANSVGVIDPSYRGEVKVRFKLMRHIDKADIYNPGDKIAQLIFMPLTKVKIEQVDELSQTTRSDKGFGSTGA